MLREKFVHFFGHWASILGSVAFLIISAILLGVSDLTSVWGRVVVLNGALPVTGGVGPFSKLQIYAAHPYNAFFLTTTVVALALLIISLCCRKFSGYPAP